MKDDIAHPDVSLDGWTDHDLVIYLLATLREYRAALGDKLNKLNELREQVSQDREAFLRSDVYDARHKELSDRVENGLNSLQREVESNYRELMQRLESQNKLISERVDPLVSGLSRLTGIGATLVVIAGLLGVVLGHFWH